MPRATALTKTQVEKALGSASPFTTTPKASKLTATFKFTSHVTALVFIARITVHAEVQEHYPELTLTHQTVKVALATPAVKGVSQQDVKLAKTISRLYEMVGDNGDE